MINRRYKVASATTAQLCDLYAHEPHFQILEPIFTHFGKLKQFSGRVCTLKVFEDLAPIEAVLKEPADGRVLVVDGGGSHRCALINSDLARLAAVNGWQGLLIYGCIRDSIRLAETPIGICALHPQPLLSHRKNQGDRDLPLTFAGANFKKDHYLYADLDGIVVSDKMLS